MRVRRTLFALVLAGLGILGCNPPDPQARCQGKSLREAETKVAASPSKGSDSIKSPPNVTFLPPDGRRQRELNKRQILRQERHAAMLERRRAREASGIVLSEEPDVPMTEADKRICDRLQSASDQSDHAEILRLYEDAKGSDDVRVRQAMVDALTDFSAREALLQLTGLAFDADEDVAQSAANLIQLKIGEIESETDRAPLIADYMMALRGEENQAMLAAEINALSDEKLQLETILSVIDGGGKDAIRAAKESYEFITGEKYVDRDTAQKWFDENYVPSDGDVDGEGR